KAEETQEPSVSTPEIVPSGSEEKREPTENSPISENVKKEEEKESEEGTKEQTHNLESGTQRSLELAELKTSQHSQQRESSSQDEETQTQTKVPTPSEENKSPSENGSISEEVIKREEKKSEEGTEEQTANLESETPTSLKRAELEKSHRSQPRRSTSQDEETHTKGSNLQSSWVMVENSPLGDSGSQGEEPVIIDSGEENKASQQRLDRQESDESSDFEFLNPDEEEEKARKKMGIRYEIKRKLINYKNKRRDTPKHDEPDDIGERHLLERSVSVPATNLRRSTKLADSTIRRHSR
ncbi:hypothetical protein FOZ62_030899, partial [Perkinsus olseni]